MNRARGAGYSRIIRITVRVITTAVARFAGSIFIGGLILGLTPQAFMLTPTPQATF
jgi:hypothetical protein